MRCVTASGERPEVLGVLAVGEVNLEVATLDGVGEVAGGVDVSGVGVRYARLVVRLGFVFYLLALTKRLT